jgi:hypothetical protein
MAEKHQDALIPAHGGFPEVSAGIEAGRTLTLMWNKAGDVTVAAAQGSLIVNGETLLPGNGDCAFVALDGRDLRISEQILALPFGAGRFALQRADGAGSLAGESGEFRKGCWTVLEKQSLNKTGSVLTGKIDAATAYDMRLLTTSEKIPDARENAQRLLRFQP